MRAGDDDNKGDNDGSDAFDTGAVVGELVVGS